MKIIGLTGLCCSGKDTIANYIANIYGYVHYSLSDVIRSLLYEEMYEPTRINLYHFGITLRKKYGNSVLVRYIFNKMKSNTKYCISSIRHTAEVKELKRINGFVLINVVAPVNIRFLRMRSRCRLGDPTNILDFMNMERQENNKESKNAIQQASETAKMATITIVNDATDLVQLKLQVKSILNKYILL
ncbi:MAG: hypothetical protein LBM22_01825 [Endomicrobium sp.]|jgi:dephospho-CoA kinase|nr:hypothetical protein [Endomicrobium sp.]